MIVAWRIDLNDYVGLPIWVEEDIIDGIIEIRDSRTNKPRIVIDGVDGFDGDYLVKDGDEYIILTEEEFKARYKQ